MDWKNLTPRLRTRLNRQEQLATLFVLSAIAIMIGGLAFFIYQAGKDKGLFRIRAPYYTYVDDASGINVGDKIKLMGFDAGEITAIEPMEPFHPWNVYVSFVIVEPYYGYMWDDSRAHVAAGDFLGNRTIEVTKGTNGIPTYLFNELRDFSLDEAMSLPHQASWRFNMEVPGENGSNFVVKIFTPVDMEVLGELADLGINTVRLFNHEEKRKKITAIYDYTVGYYVPMPEDSKGYFLPPDESPALSERMEKVMFQVETALPNILGLTNRFHDLLTNTTALTVRGEALLASSQPIVTNIEHITAQLKDPKGSLGEWLIPPDLQTDVKQSLQAARQTLKSADSTMTSAQTNLNQVTSNLLVSLEYLAGLSSNLNAQVQANRYILSDVSDLVRNTDHMLQGLKQHWLLKSSFESDPSDQPKSQLNPTLAPPP